MENIFFISSNLQIVNWNTGEDTHKICIQQHDTIKRNSSNIGIRENIFENES